MPRTIDEVRHEAIEILRSQYPRVKRAMLRLEVFRRQRSRKAVYELRDFLDHLAALFQDDISVDSAETHVKECRTHLRRCSVEPLEYIAEKQFVQLDRYVRWFAKIPYVIRHNPVAKPEFFAKMQEVKELIAQGRDVKTEGRAAELMDKAFCLAWISHKSRLRMKRTRPLVDTSAESTSLCSSAAVLHAFRVARQSVRRPV